MDFLEIETRTARLGRLSKAGAMLSRQLRGGTYAKPGDGNQLSALRLWDYGGRLRGEPLIDIADVADLHLIIYPAPKIVAWTLAEWVEAIARRI